MNLITKIISYESGDSETTEILELFSELIKTGQAWSLQGSYGRTAQSFIDNNIINKDGVINWDNLH